MSTTSSPDYLDPMDEYIRSPEGITVPELAAKWHKEDRDGYSKPWLKKRCAKEKWRNARLRHWERARNLTASKELAKTADEHSRVIARYTALLDGIMGGAVRFLKKYEPPPNATPAERERFIPDYKNAREAAITLMAAIMADRTCRGLDVHKVMDVTDEEDSTDIYAHLSDDELDELANSPEETDASGSPA